MMAAGVTQPPVRLRLASRDILCMRSMEVTYQDGTGIRKRWSSWKDVDSGYYEAVKLLPPTVTDIVVTFQVHGPGGPWNVCRVDRNERHCWLYYDEKHHAIESVLFRGEDNLHEEVDAVFELAGPMHGCYVYRAWNAGVGDEISLHDSSWEWWDDLRLRPRKEERAGVLEAADASAPVAISLGDPTTFLICTQKRMCGAARELVECHRRTLGALKTLDKRFNRQWVGVNVANTATAGMGIASAVLLFVVPPVGIGLGITAGLAGSITYGGDVAAERMHMNNARAQLLRDAWNACIVTQLIEQWMQAREVVGAVYGPVSGGMPGEVSEAAILRDSQGSSAIGQVMDHSLTAGAVADSTGIAVTRLGTLASGTSAAAAAATHALGIAGALIQTGFAIRGWASTKTGQTNLRANIEIVRLRILQLHFLLAAVDRVECPWCADNVTLADDVMFCKQSLHCYHSQCALKLQEAQDGKTRCHECGCSMLPEVYQLFQTVEPASVVKLTRRRKKSR